MQRNLVMVGIKLDHLNDRNNKYDSNKFVIYLFNNHKTNRIN